MKVSRYKMPKNNRSLGLMLTRFESDYHTRWCVAAYLWYVELVFDFYIKELKGEQEWKTNQMKYDIFV